jgi:hypothetical protein
LPVLAAVLRRKEMLDKPANDMQVPALNTLLEHEDYGVQNHLASVTSVKPGWFRFIILRFVLWSAWFVARVQTSGTLAEFPGFFLRIAR